METFDLRRSIIPFALLQIYSHFGRMRPGELIEIFTEDPGIAEDIQRSLPDPAHEILLQEQQYQGDALYRIQLRKRFIPT